MKNIRIGSFNIRYDESSMFIHSITFASGDEADFTDVSRDSDRHCGDGRNVDVFGFDMSNQSDVNGIAFTGHGNYVVDFDTEKEILEEA